MLRKHENMAQEAWKVELKNQGSVTIFLEKVIPPIFFFLRNWEELRNHYLEHLEFLEIRELKGILYEGWGISWDKKFSF